MPIVFDSKHIEDKLARRDITIDDVAECFMNKEGKPLEDMRPQHKTVPPTFWFISTTDKGRLLKVVFIPKGNTAHIKSAFEVELRDLQKFQKLQFE